MAWYDWLVDVAAVITATGGLVTAAGGVIAIVLTNRKVEKVHQLVNSRYDALAKYQLELIAKIEAMGGTAPTNKNP